jgi:hypothetical protein
MISFRLRIRIGIHAPCAGLALALGALGACSDAPPPLPVTAYEGGLWFTGSGFEARTVYVQGNRFVEAVAAPDSVVALAGGYGVAPFGEAHNHNVDPRGWDDLRERYLRSGIFYILSPNNLPRIREGLEGAINRPEAPDVRFANGGITGPGGHPVGVAMANIARGNWDEADGEGAFFHSVADLEELDRAWPRLLATDPGIVKVYLLYSEEYGARLADSGTVGWRGMDPALVPQVVARAREAGLRVTAHVESAADFRAAVAGGVNLVAHMPGFRGDESTALPDPSRYAITPEDAARAARAGVVVVTTLAGLAEFASDQGDSALRSAADDLARANLAVLREAGVPLAVGSDMYDDTSVREALYLATLGVLTPSELLRNWSETTPRAIFPDRDIGCLIPGCEASFLVLEADPLQDVRNLTRLRLAVKEGRPLTIP